MDNHEIDRLVRDAMGGGPDPQSLRRLEAFWDGLRATEARTRRRRTAGWLAAAAALGIAAGAWTLTLDQPPAPQQAEGIAQTPAIEPPKALPAAAGVASTEPAAGKPARSAYASREPTAYERVALASLRRAAKRPGPAVVREVIAAGASDVEVQRYLSKVSDARTRAAALAALDPQDPPTDTLFRMLDHEEKRVRHAAAICLAKINGRATSRRLIAIVTQRSPNHAEAWLALVACRDDLADQFCQLASHNPHLLGRYNAAVLRSEYATP